MRGICTEKNRTQLGAEKIALPPKPDRRTDIRTDGRTDISNYKVASLLIIIE